MNYKIVNGVNIIVMFFVFIVVNLFFVVFDINSLGINVVIGDYLIVIL